MKKSLIILCLLFVNRSYSHVQVSDPNLLKAVYADLNLLRNSNIPVLYSDENNDVGYAVINGQMEMILSTNAHKLGRCGNYEVLDQIPSDLITVRNALNELNKFEIKNRRYQYLYDGKIQTKENSKISEALAQLKSSNVKDTITWLSSYPTRYNRGSQANVHVNAFYEKLKVMLNKINYPAQVDLINHKNTPQKSIRVSLKGSTRPDEIIVFGAHLDSINGWGGSGKAPGADDNASGSASLLEALRVTLEQTQAQRTLEFFWYAGEESGLLGSAEIAETYKAEKKNVIAAMQLDMTMFPGDGEFRITNMTDFTSAWLRDYMKSLNETYVKVEILEDKCGYGCSDHASWFRRGYPAVFPTESKFNSSFDQIHTERDVITPRMSFEHALVFSKFALIFAMDLGNSNMKETIF